jgi:hypothetical protein
MVITPFYQLITACPVISTHTVRVWRAANPPGERKVQIRAAAYMFLSPHAVCHQLFLVDFKSFPATNLSRFVQPKDGHSNQIQYPHGREHKTQSAICIVQEIKKAR